LPPLSATKTADYVDADLLGDADPARTVAVFDLQVEGEPAAREVVYFRAAKDIAWPDPGVRATLRAGEGGAVLDLAADALARAVWIDFGDVDADLSDNALTLLPGERVTLRVASAADPDTLRGALSVRTLADALPSDSPSPPSPT